MKSWPWFSAILLMNGGAHAAEAPKTMKVIPLEIREQWSVPWEEVSGIKLFQDEVYLASDSSLDLGRIPWKLSEANAKRLDVTAGDKRTLKLAPLGGGAGKKKKKAKKTKKSQWEAITLDASGSIFILKESKDELHSYAADGQSGKVIKLREFAGRRSKEKGFEGLLLMKASHVLVALTTPSVLIEYGPKGDKPQGLTSATLLGAKETFALPGSEELYPLHSWSLTLESGCEFSDLAMGRDARVFALLKDCGRIIQLPDLRPDSGELASVQSWSLPANIPHPEGLESLGDEGFLVASDVRAIEKNLFWVRPPQTPK